MEGDELIGPDELSGERIYLGLRTSAGLEATDEELRHASRWVNEGWAERRQNRLILTAAGWLRLDALAADLTTSTSR
jgi:oxygen-independent coproporphyrinogen-3 oxidase